MHRAAEEIKMDEVSEITEYIQNESGATAEIIWGNGKDDTLGNHIGVTLIATGFDSSGTFDYDEIKKKSEKKVIPLNEEIPADLVIPQPPDENRDMNDFVVKTVAIDAPQEVKEDKQTKIPLFTEENYNQQQQEVQLENEKEIEMEVKLSIVETIHMVKAAEKEGISKNTTINDSIADTDTELYQKSQERIRRLKELSIKIKTPQGLNEIESQPAFMRKNIVLDNITHSSETNISRLSLNEGEDNKGEMKSEQTHTCTINRIDFLFKN